jgi:hypothetical protein
VRIRFPPASPTRLSEEGRREQGSCQADRRFLPGAKSAAEIRQSPPKSGDAASQGECPLHGRDLPGLGRYVERLGISRPSLGSCYPRWVLPGGRPSGVLTRHPSPLAIVPGYSAMRLRAVQVRITPGQADCASPSDRASEERGPPHGGFFSRLRPDAMPRGPRHGTQA